MSRAISAGEMTGASSIDAVIADVPHPTGIRGGYTQRAFWQKHRRAALFTLWVVAAFYGIAYTLFGRFLLLQLSLPLIALAGLVIWLLPDTGRAPTRLLERLLFGFLIALLCWPDYLALALPGLPWITAIRLVSVPLALVMLLCLSLSSEFRRDLLATLNATPLIWKLMLAFVAISAISIGFSGDVGMSISKFIIAQLYWTVIFFVSCYVFVRAGRANFFATLIWVIVLAVSIIALLEWRQQAVPWAGHIPSFLKIEDESVQRILTARSRAATGIYRVQSKFTTPLGLAEFLALATPFLLHYAVTAKRLGVRLCAVATLPLVFYVIRLSDSRLGVVGFFMAFMLYLLAWGVLRWRRDRDSLFGPAVVLGYPAMFAAFIAATFVIGRLRAIVWGTGAQQFSSDAREMQIAAGIPKILSHPWGYGIGRGADVLGFTNAADVLTIDTYFLLVGLEYGIIGFLVYYGMIVAAMVYGSKYAMLAQDKETRLLLPLTIALCNFFIIKSIFSQQENHPLVFAMLGMICALVLRSKANILNGQKAAR